MRTSPTITTPSAPCPSLSLANVSFPLCLLPNQVARTMAPSVILLDEVEKVFVSDKKRAKEFGGQASGAVCQADV